MQKFWLLAAMFGVAAVPGIFLGWFPHEWRAFLGATAFLAVPQLVGWQLVVGLKTGVMPARGGKIVRATSPVMFWILGALYAGLFAFFCGIIAMFLIDGLRSGFS